MRKGTWCLAAAVCMIAGSTLNAYAAEPLKVGSGWKATFTGDKVESSFSSEDIIDAIGAMQPDDSITIRIGVENQDDAGSNWYMRNKVLESLEKKGNPASGGAYTYRLAYRDADGRETVFFDSDTVGGEGSEEGLAEASDSMQEWFFLDNLAPGKSGSMELTVALDGETIANNYQNTLAELELAFAVEPDVTPRNNNGTGGSGGSSGGGDNGSSGGGSGAPGNAGVGSLVYSPGAVQTNDTNQIMLWSVLALICGLALLVYGFLCYRREKGER